jgi:hypothetical protein
MSIADDQEETTVFEERKSAMMEPSEIFFAKIGKGADMLSITSWSTVAIVLGGCAIAVRAALLLCR